MGAGAKTIVTMTDRVRAGCPRTLVPCYEDVVAYTGRKPLIKQYTLMRLSHKTKAGVVKKELDLDKIHDDLRISSYALGIAGGASNVVLTKMSAEVLISFPDGSSVRDFIVFDLKIPGAGEGISYDFLRDLYGDRANLYAAMKRFYYNGRSIANVAGHTHGVEPAYDCSSTAHDQYILHTEQMLVAYLAHPKASEMLVGRLRAEIRGKHPHAEATKVYNMSLHMHSTKTCCAPCEYALVGLMNSHGAINLPKKIGADKNPILAVSFLHHFQEQSLIPSEIMSFTLPKTSPFQLFVTVTADAHDAAHKADLPVDTEMADPRQSAFEIALKHDPSAFQQIFQTKFSAPFYYDTALRMGLADTNLADKTVAMSGSTQTKGSGATIGKMKLMRKKEGDVADLMARLGF
jgi:hypothetical protein